MVILRSCALKKNGKNFLDLPTLNRILLLMCGTGKGNLIKKKLTQKRPEPELHV